MDLGEVFLKTDVLVIGSGGAGSMAAIEAAEEGVNVLMVSKGEFPSGCTRVAMGAMQASMDPKDSPDLHFRDTILGGHFINNQKLVRIMVNEAPKIVRRLEQFGTEFRKENDKYKLFPIAGCTYPRAVVATNPYEGGFVQGLVEEVKRMGIDIVEHTMITNLLEHGGKVFGAVGVDLKNGDFLSIMAKSVILACGGAGRLYPLTTNPQEISGDGYALAYRAGAELIDMEFVQMRACIIYPDKLKGETLPLDGLVTIGGRFYNALGERYMKKYYPEKAEVVTRDAIAICTFKEIREGRGTPHGGVYSDLSGVPDEELTRFGRFLRKCKEANLDPRWQPIEWAPGAHHFMGGIRINERCETNLYGLYAAGEVAGGIHGANRVGGNALTDALVFGSRAGKYSAQMVRSIEMSSANDVLKRQIEKEKNRILELMKRKEGFNALGLKQEVHRLMNDYVGVVREDVELRKAIDGLKSIREKLQKMYVPDDKGYTALKEALELENMVTLGIIIASAALTRTETRGAHCREDYPERDDRRWLKNVIIRREMGEMRIYTSPIVLTEIWPGMNA